MAPRLVEQLTDDVLRSSVGTHALTLGRDYVRAGRVVRALVQETDGLIVGTVQGTRAAPYQVVVRTGGSGNRLRLRGVCSCPVGEDCKHVAATILAARATTRPQARREPVAASWEAPFAALLDKQGRSSRRDGDPIGLQFDLLKSRAPRPAGPGGSPTHGAQTARVRLRPVVRGQSGKWVVSGVSWQDFAYGHTWHHWDPTHVDLMRQIHATRRDHRQAYYYRDVPLFLDDCDASVWRVLVQATQAGIAFVPSRASLGPVVVSQAPASVTLDIHRRPDAGGVEIDGVVMLQGRGFSPRGVGFVGEPPHGLLVEGAADPASGVAGLLLAPLDEPLTEPLAALLAATDGLAVPESDLGRFLRDYYPRLSRSIRVTCSDASLQLPEIQPPRLAVSVTHAPDHAVRLDWSFVYQIGESITRVGVHDGSTMADLRDRHAERGLLTRLELPLDRLPQLVEARVDGPAGLASPVDLTGLDAAYFSTEVLPCWLERDDVEVSEAGVPPHYRQSDSAPEIRLAASDSADGTDWFDLAVTVSVDGEQVPFHDLFAALARGQSHLILESGTFFSIERPEYDELRRLIEEARTLQDRESDPDRLRLSAYQAGLWGDLVKLGVVEGQSERWSRTLEGLLDIASIPQPEQPPGLRAELRPYQRDGFRWLSFLRRHGLGGILADDMGLGKTVQALALVSEAIDEEPLADPYLVVAPTSVVHNWVSEAQRFTPDLDVVCVTETEGRADMGLAERVKGAHIVVTSYALFRIEFDRYDALDWSGLILDEAQVVKNHQAKTYQCVRRLRAPYKLAITGTPLENNLMDLWSLLSIVAPGLFPSPQRFTEFYRKPIERGADPELLGTLRRRIRPLMLRRTKEQVAAELPPKVEQVLEVTLESRHAKVYATHLQRERQKVLGLIGDLDRNRFAIFRALMLLRQLALAPSLVDDKYADVRSSKLETFHEHLDEVVREGHRALVFSQFTGFLKLVRERLDAEGLPYCYLDGRTKRRDKQVEAFKRGDAPVFLISLKAGGFGLNLTEADYCFVLDPWWNPAVEAQAVDRTHRIGQDKSVMVYRLVAADTIEEKVMELKARKQALFDKVMDDDALLSAPLTVDDIKGLFGI
jgi:superfamily II DNA or RNA helicase